MVDVYNNNVVSSNLLHHNNNTAANWNHDNGHHDYSATHSNKLADQQNRLIQTRCKNRGPLHVQPKFGICFDVDGVLARGTLALSPAKQMMQHLKNDKGDVHVPVTFVTNALNRNIDKANQISNWFSAPILPEQLIQAQGPLDVFKKFHDKFCLIVGQGKIMDIAKECGFTNMCTLDQVNEAYPLLDMVDHDNRKRIANYGYKEKDFPRIEAIILMGEPKRWESYLQVLVDLLLTDGKPDKAPSTAPTEHLPIIACNTDLQFMDRACMPRFGHGAFLVCLEALYKKMSGSELKYTSLVGKPSEITLRYAEHQLAREAKRLGLEEPLERMYLIGDTPEADIVGANLYQRYIDRVQHRRNNIDQYDKTKSFDLFDPELPMSRNVPAGSELSKQTVRTIESLLVCTGVYKPGQEPGNDGDEKNYKGHKDFPFNPVLYKPTHLFQDVNEAVNYILEKEGM